MRTWIAVLLVFALLLAGCTGSASPASPDNASNGTALPNASVTTPNQNVSNATAAPDPIVMFETTKGNFTAVIYVNEAPITGGNFMKLVNMGFYNNLTFHRVVPGFVAQGGDPKGDGTGGANWTIPLEIVPGLTHQLGALGMARGADPNSASSQFYIVLNASACAPLDGSYAVFGRLTGPAELNVVNALNPGEPPDNPDRMIRVYALNSTSS